MSEGFPYTLVDIKVVERVQSPLNLEEWAKWLSGHPDCLFLSTLLNIIQYGARIGYTGLPQFIISPNHPSANDAPEFFTEDIRTQNLHHRLLAVQIHGANSFPPRSLVPKSNGKWRRIHNLSSPQGRSVNDHIPHLWVAVEYSRFDDAMKALQQHGRGVILVKRDFSDAFRHIPVSPKC